MPDHDAAYSQLFDNPEMVEDLIRNVLPPGWQHQVDFATLHREETSHLTQLPRGLPLRRRGDRLWSVKLKPRGQLFFLFIEFQSSPDRWMALRLTLYVVMVWQFLVKSGRVPPRGRLPPVLPVVLYNGKRAWKAPTTLDKLIALPRAHPLWRWQPRAEYVMIDEGRYGRGELEPGMSLVAALFGFDTAPTLAEARENLRRALELLQQASPELTEAVWLFLQGCGATERLGLGPDLKSAKKEINVFLQRVDQWESTIRAEGKKEGKQEGIREGKQEGIREGKQEGIREGIREGEVIGKRQTIFLVLSDRFGERAASGFAPLLEQVSNSRDLDRLTLAAVRVPTADAFLNEVSPLVKVPPSP